MILIKKEARIISYYELKDEYFSAKITRIQKIDQYGFMEEVYSCVIKWSDYVFIITDDKNEIFHIQDEEWERKDFWLKCMYDYKKFEAEEPEMIKEIGVKTLIDLNGIYERMNDIINDAINK